MQTKIIRITPETVDARISKLKAAVDVIKAGGLVAFPTETVYGLGVDALNKEAVEKIFKVKGRPMDNPLIVHIADKKDFYRVAREVPPVASALINKFFPGPLTLILKKSEIVPDEATAGLDTVAVRIPSNKIAYTLIKESEVPIAAPSANIAGKPSPTSAEHVIEDLYGEIEVIIDGGRTDIGLESTVLDLTPEIPTLLRPGGTALESLTEILGEVKLHPVVFGEKIEEEKLKSPSPGMKYRHYAPDAEVIVVEGKEEVVKKKIEKLIEEYRKKGKRIGIMTMTSHNVNYEADVIKSLGNNLEEIAKNLFKAFREMDEEKADIVIVESIGIENKDLGLAIMNRMRKAAQKFSLEKKESFTHSEAIER